MTLTSNTGNIAPQYSLALIVFLVLFSVLHVLSWPQNPPTVDPINFYAALDHYDIATDRPHPPGYPLYVGLARVASQLTGDGGAYQTINLLMLLGSAICLFLLMQGIGKPEVGLAAALLLLTHPLSLAATVIAETYYSDAFFGCLIAAWIILNARRTTLQFIGLAVIFLALGLFRAVSCAELMLLALACIFVSHERTGRIRALLGAAAIIVVATGLAYALTIHLAGGYETYTKAVARVMGAAFAEKSFIAGAPIRDHLFMVLRFFVWLGVMALPTWLVLAFVLRRWKQGRLDVSPVAIKAIVVAICWLLPAVALYVFFYFLKPTYLLVLMPALLTMLAWMMFTLFSKRKALAWVAVILLTTVQLSLFYGMNKSWPYPLYRISHAFLQAQDASWSELKAGTSDINSPRSLLVWIDNPLDFDSVRLLDWQGQAVYFNRKDRAFKGVDTHTMVWDNALDQDVIKGVEFSSILVLDRQNDTSRYELIELAPDQSLDLHTLVTHIE